MINSKQGNAEAFVIIAIVIVAGFFLTGGLFQYKYTNQPTPGAFVPLTPSPDLSQKSIQFHSFRFLYLTPTPTPDASNPGGSTGNEVADYALSLIKAIKYHCPPLNFPTRGYSLINFSTEWCLDAIPNSSTLNKISAVIHWLHISTDGSWNLNLQCTGFVQAVTIGVNKQLPDGDPPMYAHSGIPGYSWYPAGTQTMQIGDIVLWNTHIAIIVAPPTPDKHFTVAEANGGSGTVGIETYPYGNVYGLTYLGFLRKQ